MGASSGGPEGRRRNEAEHTPDDYQRFLDLLQRMLVYDPSQRIAPKEALTHRFFAKMMEVSADWMRSQGGLTRHQGIQQSSLLAGET